MDDHRQQRTQAAIADIIRSIPRGDHLTAPEVFEKAKAQGLRVSLSTIYRTLNRLKAEGDVITVSGDRGLRYEAAEEGPAHDHLICLGCGLTIEFFDELIRGFGKTVAQRKGFDHTTSRFDILGYCENCKSQDSSHRLLVINESFEAAREKVSQALKELAISQDFVAARKFNKAYSPLKSAITALAQSLEDLDNLAQSLSMPAEAE